MFSCCVFKFDVCSFMLKCIPCCLGQESLLKYIFNLILYFWSSKGKENCRHERRVLRTGDSSVNSSVRKSKNIWTDPLVLGLWNDSAVVFSLILNMPLNASHAKFRYFRFKKGWTEKHQTQQPHSGCSDVLYKDWMMQSKGSSCEVALNVIQFWWDVHCRKGSFTENQALFCRNTLFTPTQFHTFTPGSCPVKPQSDFLTNEQLHWSSTGSCWKPQWWRCRRSERAVSLCSDSLCWSGAWTWDERCTFVSSKDCVPLSYINSSKHCSVLIYRLMR